MLLLPKWSLPHCLKNVTLNTITSARHTPKNVHPTLNIEHCDVKCSIDKMQINFIGWYTHRLLKVCRVWLLFIKLFNIKVKVFNSIMSHCRGCDTCAGTFNLSLSLIYSGDQNIRVVCSKWSKTVWLLHGLVFECHLNTGLNLVQSTF